MPSPWGYAPAQLGRVGRASINTGLFRVCGSRCGQLPAPLRKTCDHSCDTDSVQESKKVLIPCKFRAATVRQVFFFFMRNEIFDGIGEKLLPTKAAPIASIHRLISHWSLSKILHRNKTVCSESNPVQSSNLNRRPVRKRASAQIQIEQHSEMAAHKSL